MYRKCVNLIKHSEKAFIIYKMLAIFYIVVTQFAQWNVPDELRYCCIEIFLVSFTLKPLSDREISISVLIFLIDEDKEQFIFIV